MRGTRTDRTEAGSRTRALRGLRLAVGLVVVLALSASVLFLGSEKRAEAQGLDSTMLVFDLSGSMRIVDPGSGGLSRLAIAQNAMISAVKGITPGSRNVGVRGFSGCGGTNLFAPLAPVNHASLESSINSLTAFGRTDIIAALNAAGGDLAGSSGRRTMILLSDGVHNCGGDPCAAATALVASGIDVVVHTVGFRTGTAANAQLACIANITGGTSISVTNAAQLFDALDTALTGSARGGVISSPVAICVNSALVAGNAALGALEVGTTYVDDNGVLRVLISGASCGYGCVDGHDMNCDGVLGDYCSSNINRNSVAGAAQCSAASAATVGSANAVAPSTSGMSDADALRAACSAPGAPPSLLAVCGSFAAAEEKAALYTSRAATTRADGNFFLTGYWETLAQAESEKAAALVASAAS